MNMKKLFPENKVSRKRLMEFLDKKAFYIVLIICIAIVGATAVFVTTNNISPSTTGYDPEKIIPEEISLDASAKGSDKAAAQSSITSNSPSSASSKVAIHDTEESLNASLQSENAKKSVQASASQNQAAVTKSSSNGTSKLASFEPPVVGKISFDYAQDKLAFSKTLDEWTTHSGVDIAADRGTQVKAVADGVISEIKNDPRLGVLVIISHQSGIKTVYANLASDNMVATNQIVKQGDVIGSVGNSAMFESAEQSHLHFEVLKNNIPINPNDYLSKK